MSNLLEGLKKYFETNSRDVVKEAWAQTEEFDSVGPKFEDFISFTRKFLFNYDPPKGNKPTFNSENQPEVLFGFFYNHLNIQTCYMQPSRL